MKNLYLVNGLMFWTEEEIRLRNQMVAHFRAAMEECLLAENAAFRFVQIEAPLLTPVNLIDPGYTSENVWAFGEDQLALRPETTMGSYAAAKHLLSGYHVPKYKLPLVVWQHGLSFRREQDQVVKNMRLKQFHQMEMQILFAETTKNDYYPVVVSAVRRFISEFIEGCQTVPSDRLPPYSTETTDIMAPVHYENDEMEVCSVSRRTDFSGAKNIEVAIGTDRCVYQFMLRHRGQNLTEN